MAVDLIKQIVPNDYPKAIQKLTLLEIWKMIPYLFNFGRSKKNYCRLAKIQSNSNLNESKQQCEQKIFFTYKMIN